MSDSSQESFEEVWSDVQPIPQDDSEHPVVAIAYSPQFEKYHSYFRAVLKSGEMSERVLQLTEDVIHCNPANYTAWKHRRDVIINLKASIPEELEIIAEMLQSYPKNFQIWHHRRELLLHYGKPGNEKMVIHYTLSEDPKNYHAWAHRRWVAVQFDALDGEEEYAANHIENDFRNNSAWNYLYFIVETRDLGLNPQSRSRAVPLQEHVEVRRREIVRAIGTLALSSSNEAAHNYIMGHLLPKSEKQEIFKALAAEVEGRLLTFDGDDAVWPKSSLAEIYSKAAAFDLDPTSFTGLNGLSLMQRANKLYASLADIDPIRRKYWLSMVAGE